MGEREGGGRRERVGEREGGGRRERVGEREGGEREWESLTANHIEVYQIYE